MGTANMITSGPHQGHPSGRLAHTQEPEPGRSVELRAEPFTSPSAKRLLALADAYNEELYGHADASPIRPEEFEPTEGGLFLVAYRDDEPVACGGLRAARSPAPEGAGEVKRMFVVDTARRQGLGQFILTALEDAARRIGYRQVVLDTGRKQVAAHALYEGGGYHQIPGFTIYRDSPGNRAYAKDLAQRDED
jgi:GNAT superfamily N-acetyltransferase